MNRILMITTGGTLASSRHDGGLTPELNGYDILHRISGLTDGFDVSVEELFMLDSSNIQPEHWSMLSSHIYKVRRNFDGIVVIHGTDTMAYTASALSFALQNIEIPIVLTGSQVSIENPIADATENCRAALHMAASHQPGVYIAFNRKIILGTHASKIRTRSFDAFQSINYPYAGRINAYGLTLNHAIARKRDNICQLQNIFSTDVYVLKIYPGMNPDIIDHLQKSGVRGLYIEGFGIGGLPNSGRDIATAISKAVSNGMIVAVGSQCLYEGSDFNVYEVGRKALDCGAIDICSMTCEAVVTKLMWALGQYSDSSVIREIMSMNLVGQLASVTDWND